MHILILMILAATIGGTAAQTSGPQDKPAASSETSSRTDLRAHQQHIEQQPQGSTGPLDTTTGGAPAEVRRANPHRACRRPQRDLPKRSWTANNVRIGLHARFTRACVAARPLELCESAGETARTCDTKTHAQFGVFQNLLNRIGLESQF